MHPHLGAGVAVRSAVGVAEIEPVGDVGVGIRQARLAGLVLDTGDLHLHEGFAGRVTTPHGVDQRGPAVEEDGIPGHRDLERVRAFKEGERHGAAVESHCGAPSPADTHNATPLPAASARSK